MQIYGKVLKPATGKYKIYGRLTCKNRPKTEEGKFLKITDRKKEMFKLSAGKYIAPLVLENKLKVTFINVPREENKVADALVNEELDKN